MNALPPNVLVTSASKKAPLIRSVKDAIRKIHPDANVIAGDISPDAIAFYVADDFWTMPKTTEDFVTDIIIGCKERGITLILPTRNGELLFWARHVETFRDAGIEVVVSSVPSLQVCLDKLLFSTFGAENNFPIVPSCLTPDNVPSPRYVVKERYGSGSCGIGLNLDRVTAINYSRTQQSPIYQPFISGTEVSVDAWLDRNCRVKGIVLRRRDLVVSGESQITTTFRDANLEAEAIQLLEKLRVNGPVVLQAIIDDSGSINFIECNPRFGGASTAAIAAGLDSLYWSLLEAQGVPLSGFPFRRITGEVKQVRIPTDIYIYDSCA